MTKRAGGTLPRGAARRVAIGLALTGVLVWAVALRLASGSARAPDAAGANTEVLRHATGQQGLQQEPMGGGLLPEVGPSSAPRVWAVQEVPPSPEPRAAEPLDPVAELHERLITLEAQWPVTWHEMASVALKDFAQQAAVFGERPGGREELERRLLSLIDDGGDSVRVHGGLLAALGGLGGRDVLLDRLPSDGDAQRSGLIGLAWAAGSDEGEPGVELNPLRFLGEQPRAGVTVLGLPLSRIPDQSTAAWLEGEILQPVDTLEELLSRELAIFALGTGVDRSARTRDVLQRLLFDTHPSMQRLRPAVCFVLANAGGIEARQVLLAWLRDPQVGESGKTMARWWMAEGHALPGDVDELIAPLLDPTSDGNQRILAVGGLMRRLDRAEQGELDQIEDVLSLRVVLEENGTARLAAVTTLALAPGGWQRMAALEHALRTDSKPGCRSWAAVGLGRTQPPNTAEAQAILRGVLPYEQDPSVRGAILRALTPGS